MTFEWSGMKGRRTTSADRSTLQTSLLTSSPVSSTTWSTQGRLELNWGCSGQSGGGQASCTTWAASALPSWSGWSSPRQNLLLRNWVCGTKSMVVWEEALARRRTSIMLHMSFFNLAKLIWQRTIQSPFFATLPYSTQNRHSFRINLVIYSYIELFQDQHNLIMFITFRRLWWQGFRDLTTCGHFCGKCQRCSTM